MTVLPSIVHITFILIVVIFIFAVFGYRTFGGASERDGVELMNKNRFASNLSSLICIHYSEKMNFYILIKEYKTNKSHNLEYNLKNVMKANSKWKHTFNF